MRLLAVIAYYFWWHYTTAIADLSRNCGNLTAFLKNFFSIDHLIGHLFSPYHRLAEKYPDYFDPAGYFSALIVNSLMRVVGVIVRLALIGFGLILIVFSTLLFAFLLFGWLVLPGVTAFLAVLGFRLLIF
jgi:hypothetical protein